MPKNSHIHLLSLQLIKLYNRQIKGSPLPLPNSHSCVLAQPFLAVFSENRSSFLDDPEVKVRNSISSGRAQPLWQRSWVAYQIATLSFFLNNRTIFFFCWAYCCLANEVISKPPLQLSKVMWLNSGLWDAEGILYEPLERKGLPAG